ncbi:MAG TPA: histidine phosphatase family protein [Candidatus Acidoferrales bacterium]|nr:histidine phosphatase family protein [Candidatus Acidoferrales bacterium]
MRVILFRHGPAGERDPERWPDDRIRPLTPKGIERTRRAARGLLRLEGEPRRVLTSPLERCVRSARILAAEGKLENAVETVEALAPRSSWRDVLLRLAEEPADAKVVLVGHEPDLGKLAGVLLFGAPAALPLKKAGACSIDFEDTVAAGSGRLRWFLHARGLADVRSSRSKV